MKIASGTAASDYDKEQTFSGSLATAGTDTFVKDGVGKLRLTGDSSTNALGNFDNAITVNHGTQSSVMDQMVVLIYMVQPRLLWKRESWKLQMPKVLATPLLAQTPQPRNQ